MLSRTIPVRRIPGLVLTRFLAPIQVQTNFGSSKTDLNLKYRLGLEYSFARADFLNVPDLTVIQAFCIFLTLVRRHDSPRYVWMMTGMVIRMAQAIGLHRDGAQFDNLSPYEVEMRRRVWWNLCFLDVRSSEDQGMDLTIAIGSFDTKIPLNINESDIDPASKTMPVSRKGIVDTTIAVATAEVCDLTRQMMGLGVKNGLPDLDRQNQLLNQLCAKFESNYFEPTKASTDITQWVSVIISRLMMAKMTLIIYFPILFSSPNQHISDEIRTKLLVSAIEVAEYNHMLNAETACKHWRWIFQTYTHWYATVYLLIEISRRPWSPIIERAWVALHSPWLIPTHLTQMAKNMRMWIPLRRLMATARKHRDSEVERLRADPSAAEALEFEEQSMPQPGSAAHFPAGSDVVGLFRDRWHQLLSLGGTEGPAPEIIHTLATPVGQASSNASPQGFTETGSKASLQSSYLGPDNSHTVQSLSPTGLVDSGYPTGSFSSGPAASPAEHATSGDPSLSSELMDWSSSQTGPLGFTPWLWADTDPNLDVFANVDSDSDLGMNLNGEVNWYDWVESTKHMQ